MRSTTKFVTSSSAISLFGQSQIPKNCDCPDEKMLLYVVAGIVACILIYMYYKNNKPDKNNEGENLAGFVQMKATVSTDELMPGLDSMPASVTVHKTPGNEPSIKNHTVVYVAPWCPHCNDFTKQLAACKNLQEEVHVVVVDHGQNPTQVDIEYFPTVYKHGKQSTPGEILKNCK